MKAKLNHKHNEMTVNERLTRTRISSVPASWSGLDVGTLVRVHGGGWSTRDALDIWPTANEA